MPLEIGRRRGSVGARSIYGFTALRRRDLPLVACWLQQPQVRAWWGQAIRELHLIRRNLSNVTVDCFLIRYRGRPIGYLQCYDPAGDPFRTLPVEPRATRGIDLLIGIARSRGHGTAVLRLASDRLLAKRDVRRVITDPDPRNLASLRAFEKAGFRDAGEMLLPWGPARLLVRGRWSPGDQLRVTAARVLASLSPQEVAILRERFGIGRGPSQSPGPLRSRAAVRQRSWEFRKRLREIEARALAKLAGPDGKNPGPA